MESFQHIQVLLLTQEPAIQNLVEQVCRLHGYRVITVATLEVAHTLVTQGGQGAFVFGVIDTDAFVAPPPQQPDRVGQQWRTWTTTHAGLPLIVLGTRQSHHAFVATCTAPRLFLDKPFGPHVLADMMRTLLTGTSSPGL